MIYPPTISFEGNQYSQQMLGRRSGSLKTLCYMECIFTDCNSYCTKFDEAHAQFLNGLATCKNLEYEMGEECKKEISSHLAMDERDTVLTNRFRKHQFYCAHSYYYKPCFAEVTNSTIEEVDEWEMCVTQDPCLSLKGLDYLKCSFDCRKKIFENIENNEGKTLIQSY